MTAVQAQELPGSSGLSSGHLTMQTGIREEDVRRDGHSRVKREPFFMLHPLQPEVWKQNQNHLKKSFLTLEGTMETFLQSSHSFLEQSTEVLLSEPPAAK